MAAPTVILDDDQTTGGVNSDTVVCSMAGVRAVCQVGDEVAVWCVSDGGGPQSISSGAGWTLESQAADGINACCTALFRFPVTVAGTCPDLSIDLHPSAQQMAVARWKLIRPGAGSTLAFLGVSTNSGDSTNPDPTSLVNTSGVAIDALVFAAMGGDSNTLTTPATAGPAGYANFLTSNVANSQGVTFAIADKTILGLANGVGENPGAFTRATEQWVGMTAIYYQTGGGGGSVSLVLGDMASAGSLAAVSLTPALLLANMVSAASIPSLDFGLHLIVAGATSGASLGALVLAIPGTNLTVNSLLSKDFLDGGAPGNQLLTNTDFSLGALNWFTAGNTGFALGKADINAPALSKELFQRPALPAVGQLLLIQFTISNFAAGAIQFAMWEEALLAQPTLTLDSPAGEAPVEFTIDSPDYVVGYYLQLQFATDAGFTAITQDLVRFIDGDSWARLSLYLGFSNPEPNAPYYARVRLLRDNEEGAVTITDQQGNVFQADVSNWSNTISDTLVGSVANLHTVTGLNKSNRIDVTGTPPLIATANANINALRLVRSTHTASGKRQIEWTLTAASTIGTSINGTWGAGICDTAADFNAASSYPNVGVTTPGALISLRRNSSAVSFRRNGATVSMGNLPGGLAPAIGDILGCRFNKDPVGGGITELEFYYIPLATGVRTVLVAPMTLTSQIPPQVAACCGGYLPGDSITVNFGGTPFARALDNGYELFA
jgi:hypothetical protein